MQLDFSGRVVLSGVVFSLLLLGFHGIVYWLSPFEAHFPMWPVWGSLLLFWAISSGAASLFVIRRVKPLASPERSFLVQIIEKRLLCKLLLITLIGLALHVYAKHYLIYLRPINCLFEIRFAWMDINHNLLPTHVRISSILGHLLTSFAYVGVFISSWAMVAPPNGASRLKLAALLVLFFLSGIVYAGFIGSRNAMLAFVVMNFIGVVVAIGSLGFTKATLLRGLSVFVLPAVAGMMFSASVFSDRMFCSASPNETQEKLISRNYVKGFDDEFAIISRDSSAVGLTEQIITALEKNCSTCAPTFLYINHGVINFAQVFSKTERGDAVLFNFISRIGGRLGFAAEKASQGRRIFGPGGLPLAGAAYHDYGWPGLVLAALVFGLIFGFGAHLLRNGQAGFSTGMILVISCFYTLALSGMFVAPNVMSFSFIVFSTAMVFVVVPLLLRFSRVLMHLKRND